jgi:hypothetical protein
MGSFELYVDYGLNVVVGVVVVWAVLKLLGHGWAAVRRRVSIK